MILGTRDVARTGRSRYRSQHRWGKEQLVLQVEVSGMVTELLGPHPDTETKTWWRDADSTDLMAMIAP